MSRAVAWVTGLFRPPRRPEPPVTAPAPAPVPAGVADLLDGTVGPGGLPGVLADWIDERSADWGPLTAALRAAAPYTPAADAYPAGPRYLALADGVVVWVTTATPAYSLGSPRPPSELVVGFHRTAPGREAAFRLTATRDSLPPPDRAALRALFGVPADTAG